MKTIVYITIFVFLILSINACAPAPLVGAAETVAGMQAVIHGEVGTFVMSDGISYMLAWPKGNQYAWTVINNARGIDFNAIRNSATTLSRLLLDLEKNGFYYVPFDAMPKDIVAQILGYSLTQLVITSVESFPTVFLVPAVLFKSTPTIGVVQ